jgi:hypothetical protein
MTPKQKQIAAEMLEMASEKFSNSGCNDYELKVTPENVDFANKMMMAMTDEGEDEEDRQPHISDGIIWLQDWMVMDYCAKLLKEETGTDQA